MRPPTTTKGVLLPFYPNEPEEATIIVFDLRDPDQWRRADAIRNAWSQRQREVHSLDEDHVALILKPGGLEARA